MGINRLVSACMRTETKHAIFLALYTTQGFLDRPQKVCLVHHMPHVLLHYSTPQSVACMRKVKISQLQLALAVS